jgi:hypothetical protein
MRKKNKARRKERKGKEVSFYLLVLQPMSY